MTAAVRVQRGVLTEQQAISIWPERADFSLLATIHSASAAARAHPCFSTSRPLFGNS